MKLRLLIFLLGAFAAGLCVAREFSVVSYNVENLFDADGVAVYEDYAPAKYPPANLAVKVENIAKAISRVDEGRGPDILVFNEIELDQTPGTGPFDYEAWMSSVKGRSASELLATFPLPENLADAPSEAWLLKALADVGLEGYHVGITDEKPGTHEDGRGIAIKNVVFSRFPITDIRSHATPNARAILEVTVDVDGHPLKVFGNHWKSGAGDLDSEEKRRGNARTLRARLDEVFAENPSADVILAGDFNSHYNQNRRYRAMRTTGINDILGSQGNELALRQKNGPDLYNLWFELPSNQRGSDIYKNEWGTLMHLILSRGLYDQSGIQYVDNSFSVMKLPGLNADVFGRPIRWSRSENPGGFSDHFPVMARFRTIEGGDAARWMPLNQPGRMNSGPGTPIPVETSVVDLFDSAVSFPELPEGTKIRDGSFDGRVFFVEAPASVNEKGFVRITLGGEEYDVFTHDQDLRPLIREEARFKGRLSFYGELGTYRGRWQFVLHGKEWFPSAAKP